MISFYGFDLTLGEHLGPKNVDVFYSSKKIIFLIKRA
jgi:hypothetical protein